jgi:Protein of unknown function (DUF2971)
MLPIRQENGVEPKKLEFLYRYRQLTDEFDSLRVILSENRWWFGSRTGFDDKLDCLLKDTKLTKSDIERRVRGGGGTKADLYKGLNDPALSHRVSSAIQEKVIDKIGILCFSDRADSPELWDEYANGGYGACLCLSAERLLYSKEHLAFLPAKVLYRKGPPHIWNPTMEDQSSETEATLLRKNTEWQYQREWRILWPDGVGDHPMPTDSLRTVILGSKLSETEKREVANWIRRGPWNPMPTITLSRWHR